MELKKTRFCGRYALSLGLISLLGCIVLFILTQVGVIHKPVENPDLSQGISYAFALVFFVLYLLIQAFISLYNIICGTVVTKSVAKNKNAKVFLWVSAIIELVFAIVCGINIFLVWGFGFIVGGIFGLLCTMGNAICAVLCVFSAKESKNT